MKQSLREQLNNLIRQRGSVPWKEIKEICDKGSMGRIYKLSNAERRLRQSESPNVETVMEHGHIIAYKWVGAPMQYKTYRVVGFDGHVEKTLVLQSA